MSGQKHRVLEVTAGDSCGPDPLPVEVHGVRGGGLLGTGSVHLDQAPTLPRRGQSFTESGVQPGLRAAVLRPLWRLRVSGKHVALSLEPSVHPTQRPLPKQDVASPASSLQGRKPRPEAAACSWLWIGDDMIPTGVGGTHRPPLLADPLHLGRLRPSPTDPGRVRSWRRVGL